MNAKNMALLFGILMIVSVAAISCSDDTDAAEGDLVSASGSCGSGLTWTYTASSGTVNITGSGNVPAFSFTGTSWGSWTLTSVTTQTSTDIPATQATIPLEYDVPSEIFGPSIELTFTGNGSITIAASAFENNTKITSVTLTSVTNVGSEAFSGCNNIAEVIGIGGATINASAFSGCVKLATLTFSSAATSSTASGATMGELAFSGCTALSTVNIGKSTVEENSFQGCTALKTIAATNSSVYHVDGPLLYNNDYTTVYLCPPGHTGTIVISRDTVTQINLNDAKVTYLVDLLDQNTHSVTFNNIGTPSATGIAYSSLGMETSSASFTSNKFTLTYTLYDGWDEGLGSLSVSPTATINNTPGKLEVTVTAGGSYRILPMGVAILTGDDLLEVEEDGIGGWTVGEVSCSEQGSEILTDVTMYRGTITGYEGSGTAVLGTTLVYCGVEFSVNAISSTSGSYSGLRDLTINGSPTIVAGTFANTGLERVTMDEVTTIPEALFRYCTDLAYVSMTSCKTIGQYAFEGCGNLSEIHLGADSIEIGTDAFNNCDALDILEVGLDTTVTGDVGMLVVHHDGAGLNVETVGDNLIVRGSGMSSVSYSFSSSGEASTANFYSGGMAAIYVGGQGQVYLRSVAGTPSTQCMVVLDSQLGFEVDSLVLDSGSSLESLPELSRDGYRFLGWYTDPDGSSPVGDNTHVSQSIILYADWQKENSSDNTAVIVVALFVVAIIATVAVLFVNGRR